LTDLFGTFSDIMNMNKVKDK